MTALASETSVTVLAGTFSIIGVLIGIVGTLAGQWLASRAEARRDAARAAQEEASILNREGRDAISEFLAAVSRFRSAAGGDISELRNELKALESTLAKVTILCSQAVATRAMPLPVVANLLVYTRIRDEPKKFQVNLVRLISYQSALVAQVRSELNLDGGGEAVMTEEQIREIVDLPDETPS